MVFSIFTELYNNHRNLILGYLSTFLHFHTVRNSKFGWYISFPVLESANSLRSSGSSYWKTVLENKISELPVLSADTMLMQMVENF